MKTLGSFGELARMLEQGTIGAMVAAESGMKAAAIVVQKDAKNRIGHYQDATGNFQEWAELADSTKEDRLSRGYSENDPLLRSGELRESIVIEAYPTEAIIGSKLKVAAYQEFGTSRIPPRPFLGPSAHDNLGKIHRIIGATVVSGLTGGGVVHPALSYDMTNEK